MGIERVERYKTQGGAICETEQEARDHVTNICCTRLENIINDIFRNVTPGITHRQKTQLIDGIFGDLESCESMLAFLYENV